MISGGRSLSSNGSSGRSTVSASTNPQAGTPGTVERWKRETSAPVEKLPLEQVTKQLNKLINVIKIVELTPDSSVQRDHIMVKVRADAATRLQVTQAADLFRATIVDVSTESVVIESTGSRDKIHALLDVLEPFGIREIVRAGTVALGRGPKSMSDRALRH